MGNDNAVIEFVFVFYLTLLLALIDYFYDNTSYMHWKYFLMNNNYYLSQLKNSLAELVII